MPKMLTLIIGVALIAFGGLILSGTFSTTRTDAVVSIGDMHATSQHSETLPPWAGYTAIAVGVVVLLSGVRRKD